MQYTGIDIIEIPRIQEAIDRWQERFLRRIFTSQEIKIYRKQVSSLAVRFAAKEAIMKALGRGVIFRDIEILSEPTGKPFVVLHGNAKKVAEELGLSGFSISLSHSRENAVAIAIGNKR